MQAKYSNEIEIARAKRDYEMQKGTYDEEVNRNKAKADLAYQLQVIAFHFVSASSSTRTYMNTFVIYYICLYILGSKNTAGNQGGRNEC